MREQDGRRGCSLSPDDFDLSVVVLAAKLRHLHGMA